MRAPAWGTSSGRGRAPALRPDVRIARHHRDPRLRGATRCCACSPPVLAWQEQPHEPPESFFSSSVWRSSHGSSRRVAACGAAPVSVAAKIGYEFARFVLQSEGLMRPGPRCIGRRGFALAGGRGVAFAC